MNQFHLETMTASTTPGTHNPRISAQTVTNCLREIGERPPYTMYDLYAVLLFWPSICWPTETISQGTVNILKFQKLVACQKGLDKLLRPRSVSSLFVILTSIL